MYDSYKTRYAKQTNEFWSLDKHKTADKAMILLEKLIRPGLQEISSTKKQFLGDIIMVPAHTT
jgi:hypothetical protein